MYRLHRLVFALAFLASGMLFITVAGGQTVAEQAAARGPLRVWDRNPRYFTDGSGKAVYLAGSHTWNNLPDMGEDDPPQAFEFDAYLAFLERHHHNFFRMWSWESASWDLEPSASFTNNKGTLTVAPHPWARTGPGTALDGKPRFDLAELNPAYFNRLRQRVQAAAKRGIYVSIMLFEGWDLQHSARDWKSHPFHPANNVNGIDGDPNDDGRGTETHTLEMPAVTRLQEAYVRHLIDTVADLDNVLFEIANESGSYSTEWQFHMIRLIHDSEKTRPKQHPVGMTFQYSREAHWRGTNQTLFDSPADWISPNPDAADEYDYRSNPPAAAGQKVIISDTDHLWGIGGDADWVWKSFTRGHNLLFMDPYDNLVLGKAAAESWEPLRASLGHARRVAERFDLAAMTPHEELASSKFCLAQPGAVYVIYLPSGGQVSLDLNGAPGSFAVEWLAPADGTLTPVGRIQGGSTRMLTAPFSQAAVLLLSKTAAN